MIPDERPGVPNYHGWWNGDQDQVGAFLYGYDSLWLPVSLLDLAQRPKLVDALFLAHPDEQAGLFHTGYEVGKTLLGHCGSPLVWIRSASGTRRLRSRCAAGCLFERWPGSSGFGALL